MIQYMSAKEAAQKWEISQRRVSALCAEERITGAAMLGNMWIIPRDSKKPDDARMSRNFGKKESAHPFIKWAGGKGQSLETLKANLPRGLGETITKYAEPFVGGGALLFSLLSEYRFKEVYVSDNNRELMNAYTVIKEDVDGLIKLLGDYQLEYDLISDLDRDEFYYEKRESFNGIPLAEETKTEKAALFILLNKTCFNGLYRVNKKGEFNVPAGKYKNPLICDENNLKKVSSLLKNVNIVCGDYKECYNFADKNTLVYFDPPYRPLNTTSAFTAYTENGFGDDDQKELAAFYKSLSDKGAFVMLSNSDPKNANENDTFFDELYGGFNVRRIKADKKSTCSIYKIVTNF